MEKIPRESADKEEMEIHTPSYPLPLEIQQMDHSEKACRYCGVSYLILHEFQRLQERLWAVERELEQERGGAERERSLREELQAAYTHLEELKTSLLQHEQTTRALDLVTRDTEKELENQRSRRLHLRSRYIQQQRRLREALVLLRSSRGEMSTVKSQLTRFLETWDDSKARMQQSCISADAECARLSREVDGLQVEVPELRSHLNTAREQLEKQVQSQKLLQNQNQEAQSLIQGLEEEVKTLKIDLQNSMHEREHAKKLLEMKSVEKEDLHALWSELTAIIERLSRDLREEEESRLSCQRRCESMQEQLLAWQQKEEEATRRLERAEDEMKDLRVAQSTLQQEREELRRSHVGELERLEESFRIRLNTAEEHRSKTEALLQQTRAEQDTLLKQQETELRRDAEIELDIQRQKNQELQNKYQSENQRMQNEIPALVGSATQELRQELAELQKRVREQEEQIRESATQRQQEILREQRTGETLRQNTHQLNIAQSHIQKLRGERETPWRKRSRFLRRQ
ncbi:leucine-, glutamate- and lysine-rich protein 1 [Pimephales promelas]|uniref:leucine-, glutamate- and lysine-rich protein 1 n=1 Tax=Pimephales promelas TaxID=90988 RepID=UPI001955BEB0|nr:leucine-, glutamate- and lysine-rich protein 1 [Pimephales promelas]